MRRCEGVLNPLPPSSASIPRRRMNRRREFVAIQEAVIRMAVIRRGQDSRMPVRRRSGPSYYGCCLEGPDPTLDLECQTGLLFDFDKRRILCRTMACSRNVTTEV